jgi:phage terminase large subunit-like protein
VEREVLEANKRFGLSVVGYDPYQAALLAQRLELQLVKMQEVTFTGNNLNMMASTLLDVFRSRRLTLYDHPQLITDLGRLSIEEKSYGHRLSATRDESGHADLATALAIALPLAIGDMGKHPVRVGAIDLGTSLQAPFLQRRTQFGREIQKLQSGGEPQEFASNLDLITHQ